MRSVPDLATLVRPTRWECPNCTTTAVTHTAQPHTEFHHCPGLRGLLAPFVHAGTRAKVTATLREDYVGGEHVQHDGDGRPITNVTTTRDDGTDVAVFAPCAVLNLRGV